MVKTLSEDWSRQSPAHDRCTDRGDRPTLDAELAGCPTAMAVISEGIPATVGAKCATALSPS